MSTTIVASVQQVTHRYGKAFALNDLTLDIPANCMVGMIGPDGVGKSTLLALIAGVRKIQAGKVTVLGGDMVDERHRRVSYGRIAYMPQGLGRNLYPTLSVLDNIDFFGRLFGQGAAERRARIDELLKATGLDPFADRPCGKLSGGMKQKVSLCCSLMHDPDLLILDEPTTGVDPLSRRQFWELIDSIRARRPQMSVIVATAYMDEASRFDWLAAMDEGKVIAHGTPKEILAKAQKTTLDDAFIALLPPEKRDLHEEVIVRPRVETQDKTPAIEAEGLTRRFGDFVAVDHVSFRIGHGEIFGFLGSNGCGKTTTMKMMTGLLPVTEGSAKLFGKPMGASDMEARQNVGYMSQAFSLYGELTVWQNLDLHARLYHLPPNEIDARINELLERYDLKNVADAKPESLPLGVKQRLQLAVAVLHRPPILILDEPTSGVDPVARDAFWRTLIDLSRNDGVTIFLSTHFMNEAERCDRISLMHRGRVLAVGAPKELAKERGSDSLEDAFISYLEEAGGSKEKKKPEPAPQPSAVAGVTAIKPVQSRSSRRFDPGRLWAYARRESMELLRDPIRMAFAFIGPVILMIAFGYGITFDVENLKFAAFDQDRTPESRRLLENFSGSHYFNERPPISSTAELEQRQRSGELAVAIEIPAGFGRDVANLRSPAVAFWIDGAMPFQGETTRGYVTGLQQRYVRDLIVERLGPDAPSNAFIGSVNIENRFRYNQSFKSIFAMVPLTIVMVLVLIPAVMATIAVVREKETGSIANFRSTPISKFEFLVGKLLPYVVIGMLAFTIMLLMALFVFHVPVKGSFGALALGTLLYVFSTCGFGQLISTFTQTQVAAVFATTVLAIIPTVNFSGLLTPVSSLTGAGRVIGLMFP
ncbi:MAG: ribosome-associated ATPase/putative transporter RbbA, partial [Phyllobacterium sp.]|uniref:ribosome-associated ATPase/putative transporter RbbA n=1 Tax=Phyllobacterium sp. TaxID=1871046 RepID=UPI0030EFE91D